MVGFAFTYAFIVQLHKNTKPCPKQAILFELPCPFQVM
jgi:hypothetical protein